MNQYCLSLFLHQSRKHRWKFALVAIQPKYQTRVCLLWDLFLSLSPSSRAVPEQPERPDCQLHGDRTQARGAGGEDVLSAGEGEHAEVHDPDEAPSRGRSGMKRYRENVRGSSAVKQWNTEFGISTLTSKGLICSMCFYLSLFLFESYTCSNCRRNTLLACLL